MCTPPGVRKEQRAVLLPSCHAPRCTAMRPPRCTATHPLHCHAPPPLHCHAPPHRPQVRARVLQGLGRGGPRTAPPHQQCGHLLHGRSVVRHVWLCTGGNALCVALRLLIDNAGIYSMGGQWRCMCGHACEASGNACVWPKSPHHHAAHMRTPRTRTRTQCPGLRRVMALRATWAATTWATSCSRCACCRRWKRGPARAKITSWGRAW